MMLVLNSMDQLKAYPRESRVWVYQANIPVPAARLDEVDRAVAEFAKRWVSHNNALRATGGIVGDRFVVLAVDESHVGTSGCSIDSSVHFLQDIGKQLGVDFFDRQTVAYLDNGEVRTVALSRLGELYSSGEISDETIVFDNLVKNVGAFIDSWRKPLGESWMKRFTS